MNNFMNLDNIKGRLIFLSISDQVTPYHIAHRLNNSGSSKSKDTKRKKKIKKSNTNGDMKKNETLNLSREESRIQRQIYLMMQKEREESKLKKAKSKRIKIRFFKEEIEDLEEFNFRQFLEDSTKEVMNGGLKKETLVQDEVIKQDLVKDITDCMKGEVFLIKRQ